ncbi:MAG: hypothetical protein JNK72_12515 [Myxococcales bacterium]|nr:hypothetical protein [Myxococcales bacterium]
MKRLVLALALSLAACGSPVPPGLAERALYLDLRRVVETRQRTDWVSDRAEVEALTSQTLRSGCQVDAAARAALLSWLNREIETGGGSAEAVWRANGQALSAARELLTLERVRALAANAERRRDECPFFLQPQGSFRGVHGDARRFVLLLESQGGGALVIRGDSVALGAGGSGRVLPAVGINHRVTLALGAEVGAIGAFGTDEAERSLRASISGAIPLVVRLQDATRIYDFELAATGRFFDGVSRIQPGVRASFGIGVSTLRVGAIMPLALLWVGYELQPAFDGLPTAHTLRIGTRVGIDLEP